MRNAEKRRNRPERPRPKEQAGAWVKVVGAEADEVVDKGKEAVLQQSRAAIAFVPTVVREQPMNWGAPVMSRNIPSAEQP